MVQYLNGSPCYAHSIVLAGYIFIFHFITGKFSAADVILQNLEHDVPKLAMIRLRRLSVARRRCHFDEVDELYNTYIDGADSVKEKTFYAIKRARYQAKVCRT